MKNKLGLCVTGSFCSSDDMLYVLRRLVKIYDVEVFVTPHVAMMDTRFYKADELKNKIEKIVKKKIHYTIQEAEPYGPNIKLDCVLVYPCDANTLNKLDNGINDNCVTMLVKSSLRNQVPIVLGVYSNDILSNSGLHFMSLLNKKNFYFVPVYQDDYVKKPFSLISKKEKVLETIECAINHKQIQPLLLGYRKCRT